MQRVQAERTARQDVRIPRAVPGPPFARTVTAFWLVAQAPVFVASLSTPPLITHALAVTGGDMTAVAATAPPISEQASPQ
jgi:hypothetical protein